MGRAIGVISLKGGVGKTSSVVALGSAISSMGKKVLLVDANYSAPNLGLHLNMINPERTIHDLLDRSANINEVIYKLENFDILPAAIFNKKEINSLSLKNKIKTLKRKYDVILIDSPPNLNEEALSVILAADELIVVTTPDHPTLSTTLKSIKQAKQRGTKIDGLILNKVHRKNFELSIDDIEKTVDAPVLAVIPYDVNVLKALSEFTPSVEHRPKSKSSEEYKKLAGVLVGEKYKPFRTGGIFKIAPRRQEINREIFYERVFG